MRVGHIQGVIISGIVWLIIGLLLTFRGLVLMIIGMMHVNDMPLFKMCHQMIQKDETALVVLVFLALILGLAKARFVLSKTVKRTVKRLLLIPSPLTLKDLFPWSYILLIVGMMSLGILLKVSPLPKDIRGFIILGVGSALLNGALIYFRHAALLKLEFSKRKK